MKWFGLFVLCTIVCVCTSCPDGWATHGTSCYHFSREPETWADATVMCQFLRGKLAEIGDADENKYLKGQAKLLGNSYWIALTDIEEEGTWVWMNSGDRITTGSFTDWVPGRPNNADNREDCGRIDQPLGYQWNDEHCEDQIYYICERDNSGIEVIG